MIELAAYGSERPFQFSEIDEYAAASERTALYVNAHDIIVAVQVFALSVVVAKKMRCGKIRFDAYFKHNSKYSTKSLKGQRAICTLYVFLLMSIDYEF